MKNKFKDKAFIFGFDGVLFQMDMYSFLVWKRIASKYLKIYFGPKHRLKIIGLSRNEVIDYIRNEFNLNITQEMSSILLKESEAMIDEYIDAITYEELSIKLIEIINYIKSEGGKVGLLPTSKFAINIIRHVKIEDLFDYLPTKEQIDSSKLADDFVQDALIEACKKLNIKQFNVCLIDASIHSIETASSMFLKTIFISNGTKNNSSLADVDWIDDLDVENFDKLIEKIFIE